MGTHVKLEARRAGSVTLIVGIGEVQEHIEMFVPDATRQANELCL